MKIKITLYCPDCKSAKIKKNGKKSSKKQNFICKDCGRQFIGNHALTYKGCHAVLTQNILCMPVRGIGIRDISVIEQISIKKSMGLFEIIAYFLYHYLKIIYVSLGCTYFINSNNTLSFVISFCWQRYIFLSFNTED
jgi:hypothetical protein